MNTPFLGIIQNAFILVANIPIIISSFSLDHENLFITSSSLLSVFSVAIILRQTLVSLYLFNKINDEILTTKFKEIENFNMNLSLRSLYLAFIFLLLGFNIEFYFKLCFISLSLLYLHRSYVLENFMNEIKK